MNHKQHPLIPVQIFPFIYIESLCWKCYFCPPKNIITWTKRTEYEDFKTNISNPISDGNFPNFIRTRISSPGRQVHFRRIGQRSYFERNWYRQLDDPGRLHETHAPGPGGYWSLLQATRPSARQEARGVVVVMMNYELWMMKLVLCLSDENWLNCRIGALLWCCVLTAERD